MNCDLTKPCTRTKHAEVNAINFAIDNSISIVGADLYCTDAPCLDCAVYIFAMGISRVYFDRPYRVEDGIKYLIDRGVIVNQLLANGMIRRCSR